MKGILLSVIFLASAAANADFLGRVHFESSTSGVECTSDPCTVVSENGWVDSVDRNTNGDYTINVTMSTFNGRPSCVCNATEFGDSMLPCTVGDSGTSASTISIRTQGDAIVDVLCYGPN